MIIHAKDIKAGDVIVTAVYIHGMEVKHVETFDNRVRVKYMSDRHEYFDADQLVTRRD